MTTTRVFAVPEVSRGEGRAVPMTDLLEPAGAVILRGAVDSPRALRELADELQLEPEDQCEPFAPRRDLGRGVWSQSAWPRTSPMCMHHELGWQRQPPQFLLLACLRAPEDGGRTGLADGRDVLPLLPGSVVDSAARHGWTLVRRYADGLVSMPWQEAFPNLDRRGVEAYAAHEGIELQWAQEHLVTRRTRPALRSTGTGEVTAWSNLLAFCSEWTMDPAVRDYLVSTLGRAALPFETSFGDGSPFTAEHVAAVNEAYEQITQHVRWNPGDVVIVDNVRTAHSTEPYSGDREIAVLHARRRQDDRVR